MRSKLSERGERRPSSRSALGLALATALLLAGCAAESVDPDLSLEDAKRAAQELELELTEFIPSEAAGQPEQSRDGILMQCGAGGHSWAGGTVVPVHEPIDAEALVASIVERYDGSDGLDAISIPRPSGEPRVQVLGPFGASAILAENPERTAVEISSFSSCFELPEGVSPRGRH